jgi:hypothetical protein
MTDKRTQESNTTDPAERVRALQERRAASAAKARSGGARSGGARSGGARKRHAAEGSRVFVAGLSVASFLTIGAAITVAQQQHAVSLASGQATTIAQQSAASAGTSSAQSGSQTTTHSITPVTVSRGS